MIEEFIEWRPSTRSQEIIEVVNNILTEYKEQGYRLTLRQLYYQLVARDIIANNVKEYNSLGNIVSNGRLAGFIDWDMIEDRLRKSESNTHWENPKQILKAATNSYYRSRWHDQEYYIEIWCEKDAVSNILQPICEKWDVLFMANRGYSSQSAMYEGYKRLIKKATEGKTIRILYFGDHDPSGIDMTRDIRDRLGTFFYGNSDKPLDCIERKALNMDQVNQYGPPENPAKVTDSRYKSYVKVYGGSSWELDALEPSILSQILEDGITTFVDVEKFEAVEAVEQEHKLLLLKLSEKLDVDE